MNPPVASDGRHLLLYEPRTEGHHLPWLRLVTEDLLAANFQLTLAVDLRPGTESHIRDHLEGVFAEVTLLNVHDAAGGRRARSKTGSMAHCLERSGADHIFLCTLDEIASSCWRRAAFGMMPPASLRGRLGGIYHRPSFRLAPRWSPNRIAKEAGFRRMLLGGWLRQVVFLDESLMHDWCAAHPGAPFFFVPDPCPDLGGDHPAEARRKLEVPADRRVFLLYGTGSRRKGMHLAVEAFQHLPPDSPAFLLCVGRQDPSAPELAGLKQLERQGRARVINRYVATAEERLSFAACDMVLLPYVGHFGISAVLSQAMAATKPVIASDENLLGRLVREHQAGVVFRAGDARALQQSIETALSVTPEDWSAWRAGARRYAEQHSRAAFRAALVAAVSTTR